MFINYKMAFLNYIVMGMIILLITLFQNTGPGLFGFDIPLYLWIPCLVYWGLYRNTGETIFMVYFITLSIASTSSLLAGYLLTFNGLVLLTILLFKRIYYTSLMFFSIASALALFFFPVVLWVLSQFMESKAYLHAIPTWMAGMGITWALSFLLLGLFKGIDSFTLTKTEGEKRSEKLL